MAQSPRPTIHSGAPTITDLWLATSSPYSSSSPAFAVQLGPIGFHLAWAAIYLFHAVCALYCVAAAEFFRATQETLMVAYFTAHNRILAPEFFPAIAIAHYVVAGIHACFLVKPIVRAVYRVVTDRTHAGPSRTSSVIRFASLMSQSIEQRISPVFQAMASRRYPRCLFDRCDLREIKNRHFDSLLLAREAVECGLQAYQAHQMCQHLSRKWLNRLYVATLITNCWITPLLHHVVTSKPLQRLLNRVFDVALDFLAAVGVPVALVWSYWRQYDPVLADFPTKYWYDDVWTIGFRNESPLVFFGSWFDAICRLTFALGLLLSLGDIKRLLGRRSTSVLPHQLCHTFAKPAPSHNNLRPVKVVRHGHRLLFVFGVVILGVHSYAERRPHPQACLIELRPWFTAKPTCAIVEFSCYTNRALTGAFDDFTRIIAHLNPGSVSKIGFRHCPSIQIGPAIRLFDNLGSITFYNSTVIDWGTQAALTNISHPRLESVAFARTEMVDGLIPDGLLARDFPRSVVEITFSITNLERVPDDLDERWPSGLVLAIEFSRLSEYPPAIPRLQALMVSLYANAISDVPAAALEAPNQFGVGLSGNPITYLPGDVEIPRTLRIIVLEMTNISVMPTWLLDATASGSLDVFAGGTPFCQSISGDEQESSAMTPPGLDCQEAQVVESVDVVGGEARADEVW